MARPTKLTDELISQFSDQVRDGLPICYCCDLLEIHETTYESWINQGNEDIKSENDTIYAKFYRAIKKSYAQWIQSSTNRIKQGTPGWQGTAWLLERTNPKYMPKQQIQPDEDGKVVVQIGGKVKDVIKK